MDLFLEVINSNGLQTAVAVLVGLFIFVEYKIKKADELKSSASFIVLEVQSASRKIKEIEAGIREGRFQSDSSIVRINSWEKYRNLFVPYLDKDEWDAIEEFYDRAEMLDETVRYNNQMFRNDVEQIRINKQRAIADFSSQVVDTAQQLGKDSVEKMDNTSLVQAFENKLKLYDTLYMSKQGEFSYVPNKVLDDAKKYIDSTPKLLNTTAIDKLKILSKKGSLKKKV